MVKGAHFLLRLPGFAGSMTPISGNAAPPFPELGILVPYLKSGTISRFKMTLFCNAATEGGIFHGLLKMVGRKMVVAAVQSRPFDSPSERTNAPPDWIPPTGPTREMVNGAHFHLRLPGFGGSLTPIWGNAAPPFPKSGVFGSLSEIRDHFALQNDTL